MVMGFPLDETSPQYHIVRFSPVPICCTADKKDPTQAETAKKSNTKKRQKPHMRIAFAMGF